MTRSSILLALGCACCACSTKPPEAVPCVIHFSGAVDDTVIATSCGVSGDDAGRVFSAHGAGNAISSFDVSIDLSASSGSFSSDTISGWSVVAATGDAGCTFSAGGTDVPTGSFGLTIDSDGGATAHGSLKAVLYVHAPELTDCGPRDVENVELTF